MPTPSPYPLVKLKTDVNEDFARTSSTGNASAPSIQSDEGRSPMCDLHGRLVVVQAAPSGGFVGPTLFFDPPGFLETQVVKATAGSLFLLTGYNSTNTLFFLQIHNTAALPGAGAVPLISIMVPSLASFSFEPFSGKPFSTGITIVTSNNGDTYVASGVSAFWFNVEYN